MPLPADLVVVEVTATYEAIDGTLASGGTVTFDAGGLITDNAGQFILGEPAAADVVNGQISVTLPATDNTTLNPTDFLYTVTEEIAGWEPRTYQIAIPSSYAPGIDLSQIAPATAPSQPPDPDLQATGDLSGPWASPVVTHTHLAEPLPAGQGGTGQDTPLTYSDVGADQVGAAADALTQAQEYTDAETAQLVSQIAAVTGLNVTPGLTEPQDPHAGDLWINESAGNVLEQFDGSGWTPYQFGLAALAPDVTSQLGSGGTSVTMGPAIPSSAVAGDLWIQTSAATGTITAILQCTTAYESGGSIAANWAVESPTNARALGAPYVYQQANTPSTANNASNPPALGDLWINTGSGNVTEQMTGGTPASPTWTVFRIGLAALGTDAVAAINAKAEASLGPSVPPSATVGDLWIQTNSAGTAITGIFTCITSYTSGGTTADWSTESLSARALGAPFAYQQGTAPSTSANPSNPPQLNDLWINTGAGNVIEQMTGGTSAAPVWTQFQLGSAAISGVDGSAITPGSIPASAAAFQSADIGGTTVTISPVAPAVSNPGDLWYDAGNGYLLNQSSATYWDFEDGPGGWIADAGTVAQTAAWAVTGGYSLQVTGNGGTGHNDVKTPLFNVAPGDTVGISGTVYAVNALGTALAYVAWYDSSGTFISSSKSASQALPAGQQAAFSVSAQPPAGAAQAAAGLGDGQTDVAGTQYYVDAVTVSHWTPYQFGGTALQQGSVGPGILAQNAVTAGTVEAGAIDGMTVNAPQINGGQFSGTDFLVSGTNGGFYAYGSGGGGPITQTYTTTGTFTAPSGITQVKVEAWGGGGNGSSQSGGAGAGGGGAEYAAETKLAVNPGQTYAVTIGGAGQASSFSGSGATTVTAHPGGSASGTTPGAAGTGSSNSVHEPGGAGGKPSTGSTTTVTYQGTSGTWTVPAGVTSIKVECWGPGGGGDGGETSGNGAGKGGYGGKGGAYASKTLAVTPGATFSYNTGTGGGAGPANTTGNPASGPATFGSGANLVSADYATYGSPGQASASTGTVTYNGGADGDLITQWTGNSGGAGSGGGSSAGSGGAGNTGGSPNGSASVNGGAAPSGGYPGGGSGWGGGSPTAGGAGGIGAGGGGGGANGTTSKAGGKGGNGQIKITYTSPVTAGGGGGGASAGTAAAGNAGAAGSGTGGGPGGTAVTGGGPGGTGGASGASGSSPAAAPGGGGGGAGNGGSAGTGSRGQVRITYQGSASLVASLTGGVGQDPVTYTQVPAGYMGSVTAIQPGSNPPVPETWHPAPTPSGWNASGAGTTGVRYKAAADNGVWVQAALSTPSGTTVSGAVTLATLPSGYIPASSTYFPIRTYTTTTGIPTAYTGIVDTTGKVWVNNLPSGASNISFCQWIPLD